MVADTFKVSEQFRVKDTSFFRALALTHTLDVVMLHLIDQLIHDLLQRLDLRCHDHVVVNDRVEECARKILEIIAQEAD